MKMILYLVSLIYYFHRATAQGSLNFLTLSSYSTVPTGDDTISNYISTNGSFQYGIDVVDGVYVNTNGYISMGIEITTTQPQIPGTNFVVVPYGADMDTTIAGTVKYTEFTSTDYTQINTVNSFIQTKTNPSFFGNRMMIAEWDGVAQFSGSPLETVTFQAILITDDITSYTVFIYECGGMEWGGATIGWEANGTFYREDELSGSSSEDVGCEYSSTYSAIVYRIDSDCSYDEFTCYSGECQPVSFLCDGFYDCADLSDEASCECESDEFECDNGNCISESSKCDNFDNCFDNSDERGCVNLGLVVGVPIVGAVFLIAVAIPIGIFTWIHCSSPDSKCSSYRRDRRRRRRGRRQVATPLFPTIEYRYRRPMVISAPLNNNTPQPVTTTLNGSSQPSTAEPEPEPEPEPERESFVTAPSSLNNSTHSSLAEPISPLTTSLLNDAVWSMFAKPKPVEVAPKEEGSVDKDAHLSARDAPPSYDVSDAYPSYKPEEPPYSENINGAQQQSPPYPTGDAQSPPYPTGDVQSPPYPTEDTQSPPYPTEHVQSPPYPTEDVQSSPYPTEVNILIPPYPTGDAQSPPYPTEDVPYPIEDMQRPLYPPEDMQGLPEYSDSVGYIP